MDTWAPTRSFVDHPGYAADRRAAVAAFDSAEIDSPIRDLLSGFLAVPHCFTLQSCYGHFCYESNQDPHNLESLPAQDVGEVLYRIAYLALCIENSPEGLRLRQALEAVAAAEPEYVQFGSPTWFWERQVNSYSLQVEPARLADRDKAVIGYEEALRVEAARGRFFERLEKVIRPRRDDRGSAPR